MSYRAPGEAPPGEEDMYRSSRPAPARYDREARMYDDNDNSDEQRWQHHSRSNSPCERYRRYSPSPRRRRPSPHDYSQFPSREQSAIDSDPNGPNTMPRVRAWDYSYRGGRGSSSNNNRGGGRSPPPGPRRGGAGSGRGTYFDRDREEYHSPSNYHDSRSRSQSPRRRRDRDRSPYFGGPPSRDVILEGLPQDMTEDDILQELKGHYKVDGLEEVRVIRDRNTGASRQFGFVHFSSLSGSRAFLENYYPTLYLYGSAQREDQAAKIRIAYGREKDAKSRPEKGEGDWKCMMCLLMNYSHRMQCFRCQASRPDPTVIVPDDDEEPSVFQNIGDSDVSSDNTPSQFLLVRGLEASVSEELLAKGVAKLYKAGGDPQSQTQSASAKKSTSKVASTTSDGNLGAREGSIRRVLLVRDRKSNDSWKYGFAEFAAVEDAQAALTKYNSLDKFTIASRPVMISYIHAGVFVPVLNPTPAIDRFTFSPLSNAAMKLAYWDEGAYLTELTVNAAPEPSITSADEVSRRAAAAEKEGLVKNKDVEKSKKRKAESTPVTSTKKAVPSHLQFWRERHVELHGGPAAATAIQEGTVPASDPTKITEKTPEPEKSDQSPPTQSFADLERSCCLLCSRQFKTSAEVNKHERLSQLHRDNLKNEELKEKALEKLAKRGLTSLSPANSTAEYRDRAKERREVYSQPKKPSAPQQKPARPAQAPSAASPSAAKETAKVEEEDEEPVVKSKGAALLGKMGWTAGEGLGAEGTGRTAPIQTDVYVQGVGLGAEGGKVGDAVDEANRKTKGGYADFLERTKDKAKERFERMA
ncbi:hypothetical protein L228DRAFT_250117 [Xylona heveae TC161]|uniref:RNA-binding domain-containing protein n=1 Tax=Xylona heveae (strain CBS 132557 / TC161) TaxID=1328760 RepID=A0A165AGD0_XYLHT|nr:hypothetical protein L228DRAFT_250117 [Xylona heveae TC161]KZF20431.1 hypothetical protein L228DRAFT_250117 [Xylona heveae TC161]